MRSLFFLAILAFPMLDIASLITVGSRIGVGPTIAAILLSGLLGSILVRSQGFSIVQQARTTLHAGRFPAREAFNGLCVLIGGGLLIFPGFLSDLVGILLLTPPIRGLLARLLAAVARRSGRFKLYVAETGGPRAGAGSSGPVIEGEYRPVDVTPADGGTNPVSTAEGDHRPHSPWRDRPAEVVRSLDP